MRSDIGGTWNTRRTRVLLVLRGNPAMVFRAFCCMASSLLVVVKVVAHRAEHSRTTEQQCSGAQFQFSSVTHKWKVSDDHVRLKAAMKRSLAALIGKKLCWCLRHLDRMHSP